MELANEIKTSSRVFDCFVSGLYLTIFSVSFYLGYCIYLTNFPSQDVGIWVGMAAGLLVGFLNGLYLDLNTLSIKDQVARTSETVSQEVEYSQNANAIYTLIATIFPVIFGIGLGFCVVNITSVLYMICCSLFAATIVFFPSVIIGVLAKIPLAVLRFFADFTTLFYNNILAIHPYNIAKTLPANFLPGWPRFWALGRFLLPKSTRERVYAPAHTELLEDYIESKRDRTKWAKRWLNFYFTFRTLFLISDCWRCYISTKIIPLWLYYWWTRL
ncbi:hypothetical protein [Gimesia sp.]|uniref:hypothetical protein n=1 Tax=Gimesia sp. TaxID=2024833 RepID=UPI003A8EC43B